MRKILVVAAVALLISGIPVPRVHAEGMSDDQKSRIATSCTTAKEAIRRLQTADALLRVNRGQVYESLNTRLMLRFNARVENSGYNARSLIAVTDFYANTLNDFRTNYIEYTKKLDTVLAIDCTKDQEKFYTSIVDARIAREKLHSSVQKINQTIGEYKSAFSAFVITFNEKEVN